MKNKNLTIEDLPKLSKEEETWWNEHNNEYVHYFYRIDNTKNGKFYYGIHSEKKSSGKTPENDGYMGSGVELRKAQRECGIENFKKTIIKTFSTRDEARLEEMKIVTKELINNDSCYNISLGGAGTNVHISSRFVLVNYKDQEKRLKRFFLIHKDEYYKNRDLYITKTTGVGIYRNIHNDTDKRLLSPDDPLVLTGEFVGVTKGTKQPGYRLGNKNGSFGSFWITNGKENKRIKGEIIPEGWKRGKTEFGYVKYKNINTKEVKEFQTNCDNIPADFLPLKFFKDNGELILESEIYEKYDELGCWEKVASFFKKGRRTIESLIVYYKNLKDL